MSQERSHERISPTAWLVAYQRTLSDIPLSSEMFEEMEKIIQQTQSASDVAQIDALRSTPAAVMWEARFKIINYLLKAHQSRQVLEVAAGFSPRGLDMAKDPSVTYVEVDLPGLVHDKQPIIETLIGQGKIPSLPNFHLVEGNALSLPDLLSAARFFSDAPITVVNEGLLPYLDRAELTTFANNVHALLERFGGMWITPDIAVQWPVEKFGEIAEEFKARTARVQTLTGVDLLKNRFESEADARAFFEGLGFTVERHPFTEIADQLVQSADSGLANKVMERSVVFVMSAKTQ